MFCSKTLSSLLREFLLRRTESFLEKKDRKQNFGNLYFEKIFNTVAFKNKNKSQSDEITEADKGEYFSIHYT